MPGTSSISRCTTDLASSFRSRQPSAAACKIWGTLSRGFDWVARLAAATVSSKRPAAKCDDGMCGSKIGFQLDRLAKQGQCFVRVLRHRGESVGQGAQIEVIGVEAVRPFAPRALDLALPQRRLDHTGDADRDLVLKLENVFQRAVEAVGPQMGAGESVDQLRGDAHATAGLANRAFEHVADTELAADLFHVDGLPF